MNHFALVLSGGGARGAYQAGVVRALYEICAQTQNLDVFRTLVGVSAGAINTTFLAAGLKDLDAATSQLCKIWEHLSAESVYRTDYTSVTRSALKLFRGVSLGGISEKLRPGSVSLLNTTPLRDLLNASINFELIRENIKNQRLHSLCISATDYASSQGVTFIEGQKEISMWKSANRISLASTISIDHVMASSAIPIFFPPWPIQNRYFGDGCLRNTAPLSPAIHMGANKLIVIGVRLWQDTNLNEEQSVQPSLGRILSVLINAIFMDAVEVDLERLRIVNEAVLQMREARLESRFKPVQALYLSPSIQLSKIAENREGELPAIIRFLIHGLGRPDEVADILSYLLFEPSYCKKLVELGYADTLKRKAEVTAFLTQD